MFEPLADLDYFFRVDLDIRRLPLESAGRLMDHDPRVRQGETLALGASREQQRAHRRGLADAQGRDVATDVLHGVVDRPPGSVDTSRGLEVEPDRKSGRKGKRG